MNRMIILTIFSLILLNSVSAACVSGPFTPSFGSSEFRFPNAIDAVLSGEPLDLELNPAADVTDVNVHSIEITSTTDVDVRVVMERRTDGSYLLTPRFRVGSGVTIADLESATYDAQADVSFTAPDGNGDPQRQRITLCLGSISSSVLGDVETFIDGFEDLLARLENVEDAFDVIDVILSGGVLINEYECHEAQARYEILNASFEANCTQWAQPLGAVLAGTPPSTACGMLPSPSREACIANLTPGMGGECPALYEDMLEVEKNASDVCYRTQCAPVISLENHTTSYTDPLGRSRCEGTNLSNEECRLEYERVQGPRCPSANVTALAIAGEAAPSLPSLGDLCVDPRSEIEVLKDPASDLISSVSCMCLPALQGHVQQVKQLYEFGSACLAEENETSTCEESAFAYLCDMAVGSLLQCSDLGYQEYSLSTNVFSTPDGPLDFDDPQAASDQIGSGSIFVTDTGELTVNMSRLARGICDSALGDASVDWASILSFDTSTTGETQRLCAAGVELEAACICDLSTSTPFEDLERCTEGEQCVYDVGATSASCEPYDETQNEDYDADLRATSENALAIITTWPANTYDETDGILGCEAGDGFVTVSSDVTGSQETVALRSGPIVRPAPYADLALRSYACLGDRLEITIASTGTI